ncbi:MAG TPA: PilZ domain-containing protein [Thermoanaerobaculia bacterium]|nr:PilZ domain-containing protein [Thermoanaerobaculia bacterium]
MSDVSPPSVSELRAKRRWNCREPLPAQFAGFSVTIVDLSEGGFKLEHLDPLKIGTAGTIRIPNPDTKEEFSIRVKIVWSHLSSRTGEKGKLLYNSGVRIEESIEPVAGAFGRLVRACGVRDADSLERKRQVLIEREEARVRATRGVLNRRDVPSSGDIGE